MLHVIYKGDVVADEKCPAGEPDIKACQLARVKGRDGSYALVMYDSPESLKKYTDALADPNADSTVQPNDVEWLKTQLSALQAELASSKATKPNGKKKPQGVTA